MSRILVRNLPDGRRVQVLELTRTLARATLYTASGAPYQTYDYPSATDAVLAVVSWDGEGEPSGAVTLSRASTISKP